MEKKYFIVHATNDKIWNLQDLVSYLSANQQGIVNLEINPEAICFTQIKLYDLLDCFEFAEVNLRTNNPLETHNKYNIKYVENTTFLQQRPEVSDSLRNWTGSKKFLTFYHRPTSSRLGLAAYLFTHYPTQSLIHFNYIPDSDRINLFEFDKLAQLHKESLKNAASMIEYMPLHGYRNPQVNEVMTWYDYSTDIGVTMYQDILVDIVCETHVIGNTFFCTEKTIRPMWLKKPFIVFGSRNYLDHLHQMGFLTFNDFWNEEYDGYEGTDRYLKILAIIDSLAQKTNEELNDMYQQMQYVLEHNYNLIATQTYQYNNITKID